MALSIVELLKALNDAGLDDPQLLTQALRRVKFEHLKSRLDKLTQRKFLGQKLTTAEETEVQTLSQQIVALDTQLHN